MVQGHVMAELIEEMFEFQHYEYKIGTLSKCSFEVGVELHLAFVRYMQEMGSYETTPFECEDVTFRGIPFNKNKIMHPNVVAFVVDGKAVNWRLIK